MSLNKSVLKNEEKAIFSLRELYQKYGYRQYKMSKFEEYDLYVRNKDFLVSDNVITFTDTNGKLMALKPDVTLSIIKNSKDVTGFCEKLYYNENVYRISGGTHSFKEIMQVGLECIGDVDGYCICETVMLAAKSLESISEDYILDISHLGIVSYALDACKVSDEGKAKLVKCISEKNVHGIDAILKAENADENASAVLKELAEMYGPMEEIIPKLRELSLPEEAICQLNGVCGMLSAFGCLDKARIDFSVINDMNYYNGIVFKGFVNKIPAGILSGGQYDRLMKKMGKSSGAIGFAVYLDMLELLMEGDDGFDVDALIIYDKNADIEAVSSAVRLMADSGKTVSAQTENTGNIKYRQLLRLNERGLEILENNA